MIKNLPNPKKRKYVKRECMFSKSGMEYIDFKNVDLLKHFLNEDGKILPRYMTSIKNHYQRQLKDAIKRARVMALIPYVTDNMA